MLKELLLDKIIEAEGKELELSVEDERPNETFETLMEMQESGMIKIRSYTNENNLINLEAVYLSDTPEPQSHIGKKVFHRTKRIISEAFEEMQDEIDRLNNKIVELEKQLAEK